MMKTKSAWVTFKWMAEKNGQNPPYVLRIIVKRLPTNICDRKIKRTNKTE